MAGAKFRWFLLLAGWVLPVSALSSENYEKAELHRSSMQLRMNYETLDFGVDERLGLAGVHFLSEVYPDWYMGPSAFGALAGDRGGFFTGGFSVVTQRSVAPNWYVDAGLFLGGGGGGAAPVGSGQMIRPHLGISYDFGDLVLHGAASYVSFPDGEIDSRQLSLGLGIPLEVIYGDASHSGQSIVGKPLAGFVRRNSDWMVTWAEYHPDNSTMTTADVPSHTLLQRIGFEYRYHFCGSGYFFAETGGAVGGSYDGYAELLAGAGYRLSLTRRLRSTASLALGGAGGGGVDTQGGLTGKLRLGLDYSLSQNLTFGLEAGRLESEGSFDADFYGLNLGYRMGRVAQGEAQQPWLYGGVHLSKWRLSAVHHTMLSVARKDGTERDLGLIGLKIERFTDSPVFLTGQAYAADAGGAGGYAVGLIGAGAELPLLRDNSLRLSLELTGGAAGGGGVDVGDGAITQTVVGLTWRPRPQIGLRMEVGRGRAVQGGLDNNLLGLALVYEFSLPEVQP